MGEREIATCVVLLQLSRHTPLLMSVLRIGLPSSYFSLNCSINLLRPTISHNEGCYSDFGTNKERKKKTPDKDFRKST